MTPTLFIPIAIPGAGKSTLASGLGVRVVSTDAIRQILTGDENNQDRNDEVFKRFHAELYRWLSNGHSVFAEATNLTPGARKDLRETADLVRKLRPVRTHVILFKNVAQALARNTARERVVPEDVMLRMLEKYEQTLSALWSEDYDYVTEVSATR
jgi:predicted kinase